jgi:hypothetical protein
MLGFLPGFPYLGGLPAALEMPRLATPRSRVPAGSVAIAGRMCAVYPWHSPGGWRLVGRTGARLFDATQAARPALLAPATGCAGRRWGGGAGRMSQAALEILSSGIGISIQDAGRTGYRSIGVPVSGALDPRWLAAANGLAGNAPDVAGLELRLVATALKAVGGALRVALAGDVSARLLSASGEGRAVAAWSSVTLFDGDVLQIGRPRGTATWRWRAGSSPRPCSAAAPPTPAPAWGSRWRLASGCPARPSPAICSGIGVPPGPAARQRPDPGDPRPPADHFPPPPSTLFQRRFRS